MVMTARFLKAVLALVIVAGYQQVKSQSNSSYNGLDLVDKVGNVRKALESPFPRGQLFDIDLTNLYELNPPH